jgi:murein DD-endopeptidase MepM/ murein hydrolase activator NlpD
MGLCLYLSAHHTSQAYEFDTTQIEEQSCDDPVALAETQESQPIQKIPDNKIQKAKICISSNIGGPYTVAPSLQMNIYHAKKGDNLASIAKQNSLDFFTVLSVNGLEESNDISIGQKLRIPNQRGVMHKVSRGESIEDIALMYNVNIRKIIRVNQILNPDDIRSGMELFIPDAKITTDYKEELLQKSGVELAKSGVDREDKDKNKRNRREIIVSKSSSRDDRKISNKANVRSSVKSNSNKSNKEIQVASASGLEIEAPCDTTKMSSSFGYRRDPFSGKRAFHAGTDITPGYGSDVHAAIEGTVTYAGWMGGYGKLIVVTNKDGYSTRYGHLSRINVRQGATIRQGQTLGSVGNTGRSTGAHLHFEVRKDDKPLNAVKLLKSGKLEVNSNDDSESDTNQEEVSPPTKSTKETSDKPVSKSSKSSKKSSSSKKKTSSKKH